MPVAASVTSTGTPSRPVTVFRTRIKQRVEGERDQRGRAREAGERQEQREQRQRRDRVQHAGDREHRSVESAVADAEQRERQRDGEPEQHREHGELDVLAQPLADLVGVVLHPGPAEPFGADVLGEHPERAHPVRLRDPHRSRPGGGWGLTSADHFRADDPPRVGQQAVPERTASRSGAHPRRSRRRDLRARRTVGLRQDDDAADDQPAHRADGGPHLPRRRRRHRTSIPSSCAGASAT